MFVIITDPDYYWYKKASVGDLVEVEPMNKANRYMLKVSKHNDELFTRLDNVPYEKGRAPGSCSYRTCWIAMEHCKKYVEPTNNAEAITLLLEED